MLSSRSFSLASTSSLFVGADSSKKELVGHHSATDRSRRQLSVQFIPQPPSAAPNMGSSTRLDYATTVLTTWMRDWTATTQAVVQELSLSEEFHAEWHASLRPLHLSPHVAVFSVSEKHLAEAVQFLSRHPLTLFLENVPLLRTSNIEAAPVVQTGSSSSAPTRLWDLGLRGDEQIIGVGDTGLDVKSCFFQSGGSVAAFDGFCRDCSAADFYNVEAREQGVPVYVNPSCHLTSDACTAPSSHPKM